MYYQFCLLNSRSSFKDILSKDENTVQKLLYNLSQRVIKEIENPTDEINQDLFINLCWNSLRSFTEQKCFSNYTSIYDVIVGPLVSYVPDDKKVCFDDDIISSLNNIMTNYGYLSSQLSQIIYKFPVLQALYSYQVSMMLSTYNLVF
jgi:hypothetical protein